MTCERWQDLLLDREYLNEIESQNLHQHLSICVSCRIWAEALAEIDAAATEDLQDEVNPLALRERVLVAMAHQRRQNWLTAVPELLDALGWAALWVFGIAVLFKTDRASWLGGHVIWVAVLVGCIAWAAAVLWKEESESESEPRLLP